MEKRKTDISVSNGWVAYTSKGQRLISFVGWSLIDGVVFRQGYGGGGGFRDIAEFHGGDNTNMAGGNSISLDRCSSWNNHSMSKVVDIDRAYGPWNGIH